MLDTLSKKDAYWRGIAIKITKGDKDLADEIVHEMYIRRYDNDRGQEVNEAYIALTLKSIYMNKKTNKERKKFVLIGEDEALDILSNSLDEIDNITDDDKEILERFYELSFTEKELVELSYDNSLRDIQKKFGINYGYVHKIVTNARKKVLREEYENKYENKRLKNKRMSKSVGFGDTIEKITKALGIKKVIKLMGKDCGCDERKEYLNNVFAYKLKPRCLTGLEIFEYAEFVKNRGFSIQDQSTGKGKILPADINYVVGLHNSVFSMNTETPSCLSCLGTAKMIIKFVYDLDIVYVNNIPAEIAKGNTSITDNNNLQSIK